MHNKSLFFGKIILSQVVAFGISIWLVNSVFVSGSVPEVKAQVKYQVRHLPETSVESFKNAPTKLADILDSYKKEEDREKLAEDIARKSKIQELIVKVSSTVRSIVYHPALPVEPREPDDSQSSFGPQVPPPESIDYIPEPDPTVEPTSAPEPSVTPLPTLPETGGGDDGRLPLPTRQPTTRPQPSSTPRPTTPPQQSTSPSEKEQRVLSEINARRQANGLRALTMDNTLTLAARQHSSWMSAGGMSRCGHIGEGGSRASDRLRDVGYRGQALGETVACLTQTPEQTVQIWWDSAAHKSILNSTAARKVGIGWNNNFWTAVTGG